MEHGDLAVSVQPRWIVVLEGVLALVTQSSSRKLFRRDTTWHIQWHEVPLKRMIVMKERWPDNALEIVTFTDESVLDSASLYLDEIHVPYDMLSYRRLDSFCESLRFRPDVRAVYDSDYDRLMRFGQLGIAVLRGEDF
jgi:hypothetical protein